MKPGQVCAIVLAGTVYQCRVKEIHIDRSFDTSVMFGNGDAWDRSRGEMTLSLDIVRSSPATPGQAEALAVALDSVIDNVAVTRLITLDDEG